MVFLILFSLSSCKKDQPSITLTKPTASFNVVTTYFTAPYNYNYIITTRIIGAYDTLIFKSNSLNANSFLWNFGNGKTADSSTAGTVYDSPGIYNVTLTALDRRNNKDSASMKIIVKERVVDSFSIENLYLNSFGPSQNNLPVFSKLDLWLVLKYSNLPSDTFTENGDVNAQILYTSPVFSNIDSGFHSSINYTIPSGMEAQMNCPLNFPDGIVSKGMGLMLNLYGKDNSGTYLLASSRWSGIGLWFTEFSGGNPNLSNTFGLRTYVAGSPTRITLDCSYQ